MSSLHNVECDVIDTSIHLQLQIKGLFHRDDSVA